MTTLEMILIIYVLLNWLSLIMVGALPLRENHIVPFMIIVCPPLIFVHIFELIIRSVKKRKNKKADELKDEKENEVIENE